MTDTTQDANTAAQAQAEAARRTTEKVKLMIGGLALEKAELITQIELMQEQIKETANAAAAIEVEWMDDRMAVPRPADIDIGPDETDAK